MAVPLDEACALLVTADTRCPRLLVALAAICPLDPVPVAVDTASLPAVTVDDAVAFAEPIDEPEPPTAFAAAVAPLPRLLAFAVASASPTPAPPLAFAVEVTAFKPVSAIDEIALPPDAPLDPPSPPMAVTIPVTLPAFTPAPRSEKVRVEAAWPPAPPTPETLAPPTSAVSGTTQGGLRGPADRVGQRRHPACAAEPGAAGRASDAARGVRQHLGVEAAGARCADRGAATVTTRHAAVALAARAT